MEASAIYVGVRMPLVVANSVYIRTSQVPFDSSTRTSPHKPWD